MNKKSGQKSFPSLRLLFSDSLLGGIVFVIGMILFPLPVPFGLPTMIAGLAIMFKPKKIGWERNYSARCWFHSALTGFCSCKTCISYFHVGQKILALPIRM